MSKSNRIPLLDIVNMIRNEIEEIEEKIHTEKYATPKNCPRTRIFPPRLAKDEYQFRMGLIRIKCTHPANGIANTTGLSGAFAK